MRDRGRSQDTGFLQAALGRMEIFGASRATVIARDFSKTVVKAVALRSDRLRALTLQPGTPSEWPNEWGELRHVDLPVAGELLQVPFEHRVLSDACSGEVVAHLLTAYHESPDMAAIKAIAIPPSGKVQGAHAWTLGNLSASTLQATEKLQVRFREPGSSGERTIELRVP